MPLQLIRQTALSLLARRDYSEQEMASKLQAEGYSADAICLVITELTQNKLIDDYRFAENYVRKRRAKGYGPNRIHFELQARGINEELIAETLKIADNAWLIDAQSVWQKRFKSKGEKDFKTRAKQIRFLHYRGFTSEQIKSVLDE